MRTVDSVEEFSIRVVHLLYCGNVSNNIKYYQGWSHYESLILSPG